MESRLVDAAPAYAPDGSTVFSVYADVGELPP